MSQRSGETEAFGLDLCGFEGGTGKRGRSGLAFVRRTAHHIEVHVIDQHPIVLPAKLRKQDWQQVELAFVDELIEFAPLYVDVPIDLQRLPFPEDVHCPWELTKRPVDQRLKALSPVADKLGAPVARFRRILSMNTHKLWHQVDRCIFETYPAGSLRLIEGSFTNQPGLKRHRQSYKEGRIVWIGGSWQPCIKGRAERNDRLAELATKFELVADARVTLNDDDFDAILCALAGIGDDKARLGGRRLAEKLWPEESDSPHFDERRLPRGYVLLGDVPWGRKVVRRHRCFEDFRKQLGPLT